MFGRVRPLRSPSGPPPPRARWTGSEASSHGTEVSTTARTSEPGGRQNGEAVSAVARDGHGKGPQGGATRARSAGHRRDGTHAHHSAGSGRSGGSVSSNADRTSI